MNSILQKAEPPKPNITKEMRKVLRTLKEDQSIIVLPADKGRPGAVLDKVSYHNKMKTLIEKGPYRLLNKDTTDRLSRKLTEKLLNLKRGGYLTEYEYNMIRPKHKQPPRIYGLPKIHNTPIVSCVNTFAYDLSSYLTNVLSPLTGKSKYTVNNSAHFASTTDQQRKGTRKRDNGVFRCRISVHKRSYRTSRTGCATETIGRHRPCLANRTTLTSTHCGSPEFRP